MGSGAVWAGERHPKKTPMCACAATASERALTLKRVCSGGASLVRSTTLSLLLESASIASSCMRTAARTAGRGGAAAGSTCSAVAPAARHEITAVVRIAEGPSKTSGFARLGGPTASSRLCRSTFMNLYEDNCSTKQEMPQIAACATEFAPSGQTEWPSSARIQGHVPPLQPASKALGVGALPP